ncbi:MAG TPA: VanW family protein [Pseudonocardiaceae bacterium]|nr:VanW family protein [Pseudonocardiaceae bacterium]
MRSPEKPAQPEPWPLFDNPARTAPGSTTEIPRILGTPLHRSDQNRAVRRTGIFVAAALGLLALAYFIDLAMSSGKVPRGVTVAGVSVGGITRVAAEQRLREQLEPRLSHPITLEAGDVNATLNPARAGLTLDWPATVEQAGKQPLNPWTRLSSLWRTREISVVTATDRAALTAALQGLLSTTDREPIEGTIHFVGTQPVAVEPRAGQHLDVAATTDLILARGIHGGTVRVPMTTQPVRTTADGIRAALHNVVEPAVSAPVKVTGDGQDAMLMPDVIAAALRFAPDSRGGLTTTIDNPTVIAALNPQLVATQKPGKNAEILIQGTAPVVLPSVDGRGIDWAASLLPLLDVLHNPGPQRTLAASYVTLPPTLSTAQATALGITTQISTFTTGGFATDSGVNIRRVAEQVNGAILRPGETFSLNGYTGPRNATTGYVDAGIIDHGRPSRGIGGGISQFATTLYNATYFAGLTDVEHKEHSYYISRYPMAREATVFEGAIDVKFRDDSSTGILIQTVWTPTSVTVTLWGTKHVDVESITGPRTDFIDQKSETVNGQPCTPTQGERGFTVTDTRVIRDAKTHAEITRHTRKVVYDPEPQVICAP